MLAAYVISALISVYPHCVTFDNTTKRCTQCTYGYDASKNCATCLPGFTNNNLTSSACSPFPQCLTSTQRICNGNGNCTAFATCECDFHWSGPLCGTPVGDNSSIFLSPIDDWYNTITNEPQTGKTFFLAAGTYKCGSTLFITVGMTIQGSYCPDDSSNGCAQTVFDCVLNDIDQLSAFFVTPELSVALTNLRIQARVILLSALFVQESNVTLTNCIFENAN
jgi:hypothetical protein